MSNLNNNSSLNNALNEASNNIMSNYDLQYSINELSSILSNANVLENQINYTAEAVPVFIRLKNNKKTFLIEQENLTKLINSQNITIGNALQQIKESLEEELNSQLINISDLAVVFAKEDIDQLESIFKEDSTKINSRCEAVSSYVNLLNIITLEGAQIYFYENDSEYGYDSDDDNYYENDESDDNIFDDEESCHESFINNIKIL